MSPQPARGGIFAAMEAHKMADGDPFPRLLSCQTELLTVIAPLQMCNFRMPTFPY